MSATHQVLLGAGGLGYQIPYSLRFRASNSAYLSRTFGSPTSSTIWTFSAWVKRGLLASTRYLLGASTTTNFGFNSSDQLTLTLNGVTACTSTAVFRDPTAWMHVVYQQNGSAQTIYVNGSSVATGTTAAAVFNTAIAHQIGAANTTNFLDGYMAEVNFIDGQALTPSSFGQTDSATGVWVPKKYSGTYGSNGFYLKFNDATTTATIGNDSSGNSNNWTTSGISVTSGVTFDQMTDTPTLNYCVLSQINRQSVVTISEAGLYQSYSGSANTGVSQGTMAVSIGKWYYEHTVGAIGSFDYYLGVMLASVSTVNNGVNYIYTGTSGSGEYAYRFNAQKGSNGTYTSYGATYAANDVIGVALNLDAGEITFYKNGVSQGVAFTGISGTYVPFCQTYGGGSAYLNFGQRAFAYTPPTGFKALNTANLPTPSIKKGSLYMDATLRTGTGATASVSSLGFQPDLVWIKSRSAATDHGLYDAVRGVQKQLESNTTTAETIETTGLTAFNSNGYTVGSLAQLNTNTATYVDWAWKEGVTPGFDIVAYTGTGSALNVSHTLGAVPKFIIIKAKDNTVADQWGVYHGSLPNTQNLYLNLTNGAATAGMWNSTTPTSSVFTVGANNDVNRSGLNYISYLWSEIEGFSKFGSYTGNGSTDGPFVWCGFRPRWVLTKRSDAADAGAVLKDSSRDIFNPVSATLIAATALAEASYAASEIDFLSNGFKLRNSGTANNTSGGTFVFAAFAENPFKYARAR